jgi:coenzyme PQQ precursor peptide PqqA
MRVNDFEVPIMKSWRKPKVREISAAMEINCYASAS